jgi:hypothetical protein
MGRKKGTNSEDIGRLLASYRNEILCKDGAIVAIFTGRPG